MRRYLDASAAAKLLVDERESDALAAFLDAAVRDGDSLGSSLLLETELRRLGIRLGVAQDSVTLVLERFDRLVPDADAYRPAGLLPERAWEHDDMWRWHVHAECPGAELGADTESITPV